MALPTLLDIAKRNAADLTIELLDEAVKYAPEAKMVPSRTIKGTTYKTLIRTVNPTVAFRNANEGTAVSKGEYENRLVQTYILNPQWECDKAVADSSEDGANAYVADEAQAIINASLQTLGKVFYYGQHATFGDAKGCPGLLQSYDSTNMVVDAGGTTDDTCSSVWAVVFGPLFCQWVYGLDGRLELSDLQEVWLIDASSNPYDGLRQSLLAYPGLQVRSTYGVARIKKLTADSGKGLTDARIATMLALFPAGIQPNALFMTRRSQGQLQASRTATTPTGAPAPFPRFVEGVGGENIPIVITESLSNLEKLTT